jgi:hypothetical protein
VFSNEKCLAKLLETSVAELLVVVLHDADPNPKLTGLSAAQQGHDRARGTRPGESMRALDAVGRRCRLPTATG